MNTRSGRRSAARYRAASPLSAVHTSTGLWRKKSRNTFLMMAMSSTTRMRAGRSRGRGAAAGFAGPVNGSAAATAGKVTVKRVPSPSRLVSSISPPIMVTSRLHRVRPRSAPLYFCTVCSASGWKSSNSLSRSAAGMPMPLSSTRKRRSKRLGAPAAGTPSTLTCT